VGRRLGFVITLSFFSAGVWNMGGEGFPLHFRPELLSPRLLEFGNHGFPVYQVSLASFLLRI